MSWVKIDDAMPDHLKIAPLSDAAFRAYVTSICYAARALSDGFIPYKKAKEFAGRPRVVQELTTTLWEPVAEGFMVHDYLQYNPPREQVLAEREAAKARMQGVRSAHVRPNKQANSGRSSPTPVPVPVPNPIKRRPTEPLPPPDQETGEVVVPVVRAFERCFGRLLSPMEIEQIHALADEHPRERIDYALRETASLAKKNVRYVQAICEKQESNGDERTRPDNGTNGAGRHVAAEPTLPGPNGAYLHAVGFGSVYVDPPGIGLGEEGVGEEAVAVGVEAPR